MEIKAMWAVLAVTIALVALAPPPQVEAAVGCGEVANKLSPCINYVMNGRGVAPPATCCTGIKGLYNEAATTADRQSVCNCLKSVAGNATPLIISTAASLPAKCGISIPYKISPSTDCSKVH